MPDNNIFGGAFRNSSRYYELVNVFLDKEVEITVNNGPNIVGKLDFFSDNFVIISQKYLINLRYVVSIKIIS